MGDSSVCKICQQQKALYTCPKCQVPYCCLKCYQSPSHEKCSEQFYEANVREELQQTSASDAEKQAMLEMLKQFEEDCAEDDQNLKREEEVNNLASRLDGVDLDGDPQQIWEKLSEEERDKFTSIVKEQEFSDIVEEWLPWWTYQAAKKPLVTDIDEPADEEKDLSQYQFPEISTTIHSFSHFSKSEPSPCIKYNAVNILLAYTYIVMRYNGEHQDMCIQCSEDIISISDVLLRAANFGSAGEAIRSLCGSLKKLEDLFISMEYFTEVLDNVVLVLHGPEEGHSNDFLLMAFSDLTTLIDNTRTELKIDPAAKEGRKQLALVKRKLDYYCGWVLSYSESHIAALIPEVIAEKEKLLAEGHSHKKAEELTKRSKESKTDAPKIQVIT